MTSTEEKIAIDQLRDKIKFQAIEKFTDKLIAEEIKDAVIDDLAFRLAVVEYNKKPDDGIVWPKKG